MLHYHQFFTELFESENIEYASFSHLPKDAPYGFVVWPDGNFVIVEDWGGHNSACGYMVYEIVRAGGAKIAIKPDDSEYVVEYIRNKATNRAKKTTKDLADFYGLPVEFEHAPWMLPENKVMVEDYPLSWNKQEFDKISSFNGKLKYANTHLAKIASGSGRAVFKIDEQKALKIAKNKKGLAQNSIESEGYLQNYDIVARVFDHGEDVKNIGPFFVEMELGSKLTNSRFKQLIGVGIKEVEAYFDYIGKQNNGWQPRNTQSNEFWNKMHNNEFIIDVKSLMDDYDMCYGDLGRLSTYGEVMREGRPKVVLVDFGLTNRVFTDYYKVG